MAKEYNEMETEYQIAKAHYNEIQQKLLGARVSQGMEEEQLGETFQVVEPAFLPEKPFKPNRLAIVLIGIVLGTGVSVGAASLKEFTDKSIRDRTGLEEITGVEVSPSSPGFSLPKTCPEPAQEDDNVRRSGGQRGGLIDRFPFSGHGPLRLLRQAGTVHPEEGALRASTRTISFHPERPCPGFRCRGGLHARPQSAMIPMLLGGDKPLPYDSIPKTRVSGWKPVGDQGKRGGAGFFCACKEGSP